MSPRRSISRASIAVTAAFVLALGLAACGGASATSQVRSKVMQFATAVHSHDYRTICTSVLASALLADIADGGLSCEKAMALGLDKVEGARLVIGKIKVSGSQASVLTLSQAKGEKTSLATLVLSKGSSGWRIVSLGDAAGS